MDPVPAAEHGHGDSVAKSEHAVERVHPPAWLMKLMNPVTRWLLGSRLHTRVSEVLLLLHYRGRRTGRRYTVPVGYNWIDGRLSVLTNSSWRHNFEGGRDLEVTYRGQRRPAHAQLVSDPETVATIYHELISDLGVQQAQRRLGIRINVARVPSHDELRDAIVLSGLSVVRVDLRAPSGASDG
jgi:F420H(2)-dependent quinone reductase